MFQKDIEILTVNGWKGFGSLEGELVHEFLPSTNSITLSPVEKVRSEPFKGKLRGILGERPSRGIIATSDHKTIIYTSACWPSPHCRPGGCGGRW